MSINFPSKLPNRRKSNWDSRVGKPKAACGTFETDSRAKDVIDLVYPKKPKDVTISVAAKTFVRALKSSSATNGFPFVWIPGEDFRLQYYQVPKSIRFW
jgi:hypothetical protein